VRRREALCALGALAASQGTMNNFTFGNDEVQYYETICGGTGAGPDFDGTSAVHSHMTNTRMTDPEVLENRFPIRVELKSLTTDDFVRILTEPDASLTLQYSALLRTEEVELEFTEGGVRRIAEVAYQVNENTENIGARRLHTVMERLLETVSFAASDKSGLHVTIDANYVDEHLAELSKDEDLSRYIL